MPPKPCADKGYIHSEAAGLRGYDWRQQVAQLPQRDCAAGKVSVAKSGRLERGDNILRTL